MKQLYINDSRLIIDEENSYFPFTYTINDLENINVINLPISKDIKLPRCATNDEIFGFIGSLTRITSNTTDNKIGISFNQTKKCIYKLTDGSEIISKGLLIVKSVNDKYYTVQLLDALIEKFENLNNKQLNEIDLYGSDNQVIEFISTAKNVLKQTDLIPTFNYNESDLSKDKIVVKQKNSSTNTVEQFKYVLNTECEALQVRSYKSYEIKYALPIQKLINSINLNNLGTTITFDEQLNVLFEDVHILMNKPLNTQEQIIDENLSKSPNVNLLNNSAYVSMSANNTGLGTSVLKNDEVNPYYTATPDANKTVSLFGNQYTYIVGNKYINSIWVRHHHTSNITFTLYNNNNQASSSKNTIVEPNKWTQISTNAYINTYASASYIILSTNVNGKSVDYKMSKIEQVDNLTDTATLWTRSTSDTTFNYDTSYRYKQNVDKIYNVDGYYYVDKLFYRPFSNKISMKENGNYYFDLNFTIDFKQSVIIQGSKTLTYVVDTNVFTKTNYVWSTVDGDYIGSLWIKNRIGVYTSKYNGLTEKPDSNNSVYIGNEIVTEVKLFYNVNSFFDLDKQTMQVNGNYLLKTDLYPYKYLLENNKDVFISIELSEHQPYNEGFRTRPFGSNEQEYKIKINSGKVVFKTNEIRTGDLINSSKISPKIGIKDFLLTIIKYFNLGVKIKDDNLYIFKKNYHKTDDILILDTINDINVGVINFNKIKMTTNVIESSLMSEYKSITKEVYGQKNINTGYSIKEVVKEVNYDVTIPFLFKDTDVYAYNEFMNYFNGGYNMYNHGNVVSSEDKIVLGYLNNINTPNFNTFKYNKGIHISDDTDSEIKNLATGFEVEETKFCHSNLNILLDTNNSMYYYKNDNTLSSYYTFSPYQFNENNIVIKSLEMNKPKFTYSDLNDNNYPDNVSHFDLYFKKEITDKYDDDTHILKTKMFIDTNIDVFKIYNYKNSNYLLSKINEYDPTIPDVYEVELLKVNDVNNYITPINQILKYYTTTTAPTSELNNNGTITYHIQSGSGEYTYSVYKNGILINSFMNSDIEFTINNIEGGVDYKIKIEDAYNTSIKIFNLLKVGDLSATYNYTNQTDYNNLDASISVKITIGVPEYFIHIYDSTNNLNYYLNNIKNNGTYNFYNLRNGNYTITINDLSDENNQLVFNFSIYGIKTNNYTITQTLIFNGDITTYSNYFNRINNEIYNKYSTNNYTLVDKIEGGTLNFSYSNGYTYVSQINNLTNYLQENQNYTYTLKNNLLYHTSGYTPVELNLYDSGIINFTSNNGSGTSTIMNNSYGYGEIVLEVGTQNINGLFVNPNAYQIYEYTDGGFAVKIRVSIQQIGIIIGESELISNLSTFIFNDISCYINRGSGWEYYIDTPILTDTNYYNGIYILNYELLLPPGVFSIPPTFNNNISNIKFTTITDSGYTYVSKFKIDSSEGYIYLRTNDDMVVLINDDMTKYSYYDLPGDNGTPPIKVILLNYKIDYSYVIS